MSENTGQNPGTVGSSAADEARPLQEYVYRGRTITSNGEDTVTTTYNSLESLLKGADLYDDGAFLTEILPFFNSMYLQNDYKVSVYMELLDRICDWRFPNLTREMGREEAGRLTFRGFRRTILGRVVLASLGMIGPERLIKLAPSLFKRVVDAPDCSVKQTGPYSYIFDYPNASGTYEDKIGIFKEAWEQAGAGNVQCEVKILTSRHWEFWLEWK